MLIFNHFYGGSSYVFWMAFSKKYRIFCKNYYKMPQIHCHILIFSPSFSSFGKLFPMNMVSVPMETMKALLIFNWRESMFTIMKHQVENTFQGKEICSNLLFCVNLGLLALYFVVKLNEYR